MTTTRHLLHTLRNETSEAVRMATGAGDGYWKSRNLPSAFKHSLLQTYMPQFAGMTASRSDGKRVVYLDGYAGRGRYADGGPASGELVMQIALAQRAQALAWTCFFVEKDDESAVALAQVASEYKGHGIDARVHHGSVVEVLDKVVSSARGVPWFLFLDPTGFGLPYATLVDLLTSKRRETWPPTEVLLNFSLEAVRRTAGHVPSPHANEALMKRLDDAIDGPWWRDLFRDGYTEAAVSDVSSQFARRLNESTDMHVITVPVRRAPDHKPLYHLVFGTRKQHGLWVFGDSVARATQVWWDSLEEVEGRDAPDTLFSMTSMIRPKLETVERDAVSVIAENVASLLDEHYSFKVVDHTLRVFGDFYGQVRDRVVAQAIQHLYNQGRTGCTGKGGKPRDLIVTRNHLTAGLPGISS